MLKAFKLAIMLLSSGSVSESEAEKLAGQFIVAAQVTGEDPVNMIGAARHESNFDQAQRSPAGARGLLQLMPRWWGWQPDPQAHLIQAGRVMQFYRIKCGPRLRAIIGYRSGRCTADPRSITFRRAAATYRLTRNLRAWLLDTRKPLRYVPLPTH